MSIQESKPGPNWVPYKIIPENNVIACQWLYVKNKAFTEPFFSETIQQCKLLPENNYLLKQLTDFELLPVWSREINSVTPTAFIFHVSRCGSTLASQLLSLEPKHIVLSEVPFFDDILRLPFNKKAGASLKQTDNYFKAAVRFYAQKRTGEENNLFIKTDSWHLFFYKQIRKVYPSVPFIIMYRTPYEIIRSQKRLRGMQSVPGIIEAELFGFEEQDITYDLDLYMSRVLEKYYRKVLEIMENDPFCILLNYKEGMEAIMKRIIAYTGISASAAYLNKIKERSQFHGKYPNQIFSETPATENPPPYLQKCLELYDAIEEKRRAFFKGS